MAMKYGENPYYGILGNPYATMYANPFPMKTPEQYRSELMAQVNPQMQQYQQMYDATQAQVRMEANSGSYYKVSSYDEMMKVQAPADGKPIMVLDENEGRLYSKRFENGQTYVVGFQLVPLDGQEGKGSENPSGLEKTLKSINDRLSALEGKNVDTGNASK